MSSGQTCATWLRPIGDLFQLPVYCTKALYLVGQFARRASSMCAVGRLKPIKQWIPCSSPTYSGLYTLHTKKAHFYRYKHFTQGLMLISSLKRKHAINARIMHAPTSHRWPLWWPCCLHSAAFFIENKQNAHQPTTSHSVSIARHSLL